MSWKPQASTLRGVVKEEMNQNGRKPRSAGAMLRKRQYNRRPDVTNLLGRFGRYLNERREQENLSIRALALRAQMPYTNIFQLENLRKNPRLTELEQLAEAFNEPLSEFLEPVLHADQND